VRFYHNVRKEGDPPPPFTGEEGSQAKLRAVMYKGQRKKVLNIGDEVPKTEVLDFFSPLSEDLTKVKVPKAVPLVSNASFGEDVVSASGQGKPMILLQMYEDTCFLCFLMRPFVNSLGELLEQSKAPFVFKRINIEKNDFPDDCPVARGTPTFVLFRGPAAPASKWEEFKPKELCEKITQVFPSLSDDVVHRMYELQGQVSRRFQLFTQLVMWTIELQKLEALVAGNVSNEPSEDSDFNAVVSQMMTKDMRRLDGMEDNLTYLQKEVDEVEHDAALMGAMLAESVMRRETAEKEKFQRR